MKIGRGPEDRFNQESGKEDAAQAKGPRILSSDELRMVGGGDGGDSGDGTCGDSTVCWP